MWFLCRLIDVCACLSSVHDVVKSNPVLSAGCSVVGTPKVTDHFTGLVSYAPFLRSEERRVGKECW